jgi:hypothetical protein
MLSPDPKPPMMPNALVALDLLVSLNVLTELGLEDIGGDLHVLAFLVVPLPVEEPSGDVELLGIGDDLGDLVALAFGHLSCADAWVDLQDFADQEGESAPAALYRTDCEGCWLLSVDVRVQDTQDVLEIVRVLEHEC